MTREEDRAQMMTTLGITALRPGKNGSDPKAPNYANYDESKANPFNNYPDVMKLENGKVVKTPADWQKRKAEITELFDREVYGRMPKNIPGVQWEVTQIKDTVAGDIPVIIKTLVGHVDNSSYPYIAVNMQGSVTTPKNITGQVPVLVTFGGGGGPRPAGPRAGGPAAAQLPPPNPNAPPSFNQQLLMKGWGFATLNPASIQPDNGGGLTSVGIIALVNKGQSRKPEDWGSLRAWAWGADRLMDYFEKDNDVDEKRVAITGHSRYGKAALVTMAYNPRYAAGFISSSGEGGASLYRRDCGEIIENVAAASEYHWMAGNFLKYAGPLQWSDLPVDAHEIIALCAPRPLFISGGSYDKGDGWVDSRGMFMAASMAEPVYVLLGAKGMGTKEFPGEKIGLMNGELAFRQHEEGHTPGPNQPVFLEWASRYFDKPVASTNMKK